MSAATPLDRNPLYVNVPGLDLRDPIESALPTLSYHGVWDDWLSLFKFNADIGCRCGLIHQGLEYTMRRDKAKAFAWYLRLANGHQNHRHRHSASPLDQIPETMKMRNLAFQMICKVFAVRPGGPEHDSLCVHYLDSEEALSTFMWFIQARACGNSNVRHLGDHQEDSFIGFLRAFVRLHWSEVIIDRTCENYPKDRAAFVSWLVANRPCLLRFLYRYDRMKLAFPVAGSMTPNDVLVLRSCVLGDKFMIRKVLRKPRNMQEVREYGDEKARIVAALVAMEEARHRDSEQIAPTRKCNRR
jgi:hypothetical protein